MYLRISLAVVVAALFFISVAEAAPPRLILVAAGSMHNPRGDHEAVKLDDGRVMMVGGDGLYGTEYPEVFNPSNYSWTEYPTGSNYFPETGMVAVRLTNGDGRVFVTGGSSTSGSQYAGEHYFLFDPVTNTWDVTLLPNNLDRHINTRHGPEAFVRDNGRVFLVGGQHKPGYWQYGLQAGYSNKMSKYRWSVDQWLFEDWNDANNAWFMNTYWGTGFMSWGENSDDLMGTSTSDFDHVPILFGGWYETDSPFPGESTSFGRQVFTRPVPWASNRWYWFYDNDGTFNYDKQNVRDGGMMACAQDSGDKWLVGFGGEHVDNASTKYVRHDTWGMRMGTLHFSHGSFKADMEHLNPMGVGRTKHAASTGKYRNQIFAWGGRDDGLWGGCDCALDTVAMFDCNTGNWTNLLGTLVEGRYGHTVTRLDNGRYLVAGGFDSNGDALDSWELYIVL